MSTNWALLGITAPMYSYSTKSIITGHPYSRGSPSTVLTLVLSVRSLTVIWFTMLRGGYHHSKRCKNSSSNKT